MKTIFQHAQLTASGVASLWIRNSPFRSITVLACVALSAGTITLRSETTPLDQPLVEDKANEITCELKEPPKQSDIPVFGGTEAKNTLGTYHYRLYLPKGYLADPARRWPCMFVAAPGGNARPGPNMVDRLKAGGYMAVALTESKNGPWEPIIGNFLAAHDDAIKRVRIQEGLKFATGFSGGARASSVFVQIRPGFSGLIMQGAGAAYTADGLRYVTPGLKRNPGLFAVMIMGDADKNASEIAKMQSAMDAAHLKVMGFKGGHTGAPAELFSEAMDWLEQQIYVEGPVRPELKPVYLQRFAKQQEDWAAVTVPWERYRDGQALLDFAKSRALAADPAVASSLRTVQTEVARLRADPAIAKEILAADAWRRLEESHRSAAPAKVAADCRDFAKRYSGTEAARKAEAKVGTP